ncbi:hypothetical protein HED60_04495 [Planctomycetales bacterium ZRK34]|nr:hypothetical protein HED60_04495 [Planctomycetales bacterium ZRK34]
MKFGLKLESEGCPWQVLVPESGSEQLLMDNYICHALSAVSINDVMPEKARISVQIAEKMWLQAEGQIDDEGFLSVLIYSSPSDNESIRFRACLIACGEDGAFDPEIMVAMLNESNITTYVMPDMLVWDEAMAEQVSAVVGTLTGDRKVLSG